MAHVQDVQGLLEWRARAMVEIEQLKQGVSNFRNFQERGNKFFDRFEAIADEDEKVAKKQWKRSDKIAVMAILTVVFLPPIGYLSDKVVIFFGDLYQITQEWHQVHKSELHQKSFANPPQKDYAQNIQQLSVNAF